MLAFDGGCVDAVVSACAAVVLVPVLVWGWCSGCVRAGSFSGVGFGGGCGGVAFTRVSGSCHMGRVVDGVLFVLFCVVALLQCVLQGFALQFGCAGNSGVTWVGVGVGEGCAMSHICRRSSGASGWKDSGSVCTLQCCATGQGRWCAIVSSGSAGEWASRAKTNEK